MSARKNFEIVGDERKDRAYYENAIAESVSDFYSHEFGAETVAEIAKLSQNSWVACMEYVRRNCINRDDLLTTTSHTPGGHGSKSEVWNEEYSGEVIEVLCSLYCSLSFLYDKIPTLYGFHVLTGIPRTTLLNWANSGDGVSSASRVFAKKKAIEDLRVAKGVSLENMAVSGGKATIGAIAALNNGYWGKAEIEQTREHVLTAHELPDLSGYLEMRDDAAGLPVLGGEAPERDALPVLGGVNT